MEFKTKKVIYSAIVLDDISHKKLSERFTIPDGWEILCHHCTISLSTLKGTIYESHIGEQVSLLITHYGNSDLACAAKVNFQRLIPGQSHITISVNKAKGGKPKDSNLITDWSIEFSTPITLTGIIQEIYEK